MSSKPTKLQRNRIIEIFDDVNNYKRYHEAKQDIDNISSLIIEK